MSAHIMVSHTFEAAHRMLFLGGKCQNLHGHSWSVEVIVSRTGPVDETGIVVDFGTFKRALRNWIDEHLDHGAMLGIADAKLIDFLDEDDSQVFVFGAHWPSVGYSGQPDLTEPSVENVARLLHRVAENILAGITLIGDDFGKLVVAQVTVRETPVNAAVWIPDAITGEEGVA